MKKTHYIVIGIAVALVALLFFGGSIVKPQSRQNTAIHQHNHDEAGHHHEPIATVNIDSFIEAALKKMSPQKQAELKDITALLRHSGDKDKIVLNEQIGKFWIDNKQRKIGAYYIGLSGKLENSEKKLNFAAHSLTEELYAEQNPSMKKWLIDEAISFYEQSLAINPDNDEVRIDYAMVVINAAGDPMKGVTELLSIDRKDSLNIPVNVILGKMAIESGQLDKAIERGHRVIRLDNENWEAYVFLAEAYKQSGDKTQAIDLLNKAKSIMNNPDFSKDVDKYIESFK